MCGIVGLFGKTWQRHQLDAMLRTQRHRGPDAEGIYLSRSRIAGLGHNRLSIIDLSEAGRQPIASPDGRYHIVFNGEIYNYLELRNELSDYQYASHTDTEVILAAYIKWGAACLNRFVGMFAFIIWDEQEQKVFAARDRFGVKPLNYSVSPEGTLSLASEIKAIHAAGVPRRSDAVTWATYLACGLYEHSERTFWEGIKVLPPGHILTWRDGELNLSRWYYLPDRTGIDFDSRPLEVVEQEYLELMEESIRLRFRSDVPVGINLSGGLDSSTLLGIVNYVQGAESDVKAFTYVTGDAQYDELPWVEQMLAQTRHPLVTCPLRPEEVPALSQSVQDFEDEPYGGLPTVAYAKVFEHARASGVIVLLDGQGMDEQWAGYDYYLSALDGTAAGTVQGARDNPFRAECLLPEFRGYAEKPDFPKPYPDALRNLQYRDLRYTKIPRSMRFNDRVSMRSSTELREPFLDHRLVELALRQPLERKIAFGTRKWLLRRIAGKLLNNNIVEAPKRPLSTPQREWLRGPLRPWAGECIEQMLAVKGGIWLDPDAVRRAWQEYCDGKGDNSVFVWQWISLGMMSMKK